MELLNRVKHFVPLCKTISEKCFLILEMENHLKVSFFIISYVIVLEYYPSSFLSILNQLAFSAEDRK